MTKSWLVFYCFFLLTACKAQGIKEYPKREFRAIWVTTLNNIDWPSKKGLSIEKQKAELLNILQVCQKNKINAIIFQVRPAADAFYKSDVEPWSEFLTGKQGKAPEPFYDPLAFLVEECHQRNIELHAWFNPYRAIPNIKKAELDSTHITFKKPAWFFQYGNRVVFNPGIPEVRNYITAIIMDVVKKYNIDGVHFDDYFYPYPIENEVVKDDSTFIIHQGSFIKKDDWRRNNVDLLIQMVSDSIKMLKPYVKFGISPMGVWRNQSSDIRGSDTKVWQPSYDYLYADTRKWLEKGWIDYIAPQIYWSMDYDRASYRVLIPWWEKNSFNKHVYIGHAAYKINNNEDTSWFSASQIPTQIRFNRDHKAIQGSIFFSLTDFLKNANGLQDTLKNDLFKYHALIPPMSWKDSIPPNPPKHMRADMAAEGVYLRWYPPKKADDGESATYYIIYRLEKEADFQSSDAKYIIGVQRECNFLDKNAQKGKKYIYAITSVDRLHNESKRYTAVELFTEDTN